MVESFRGLVAVESGLLDLAAADLQPFAYGAPQRADAFDVIVDRMLESRAILFATPVYWYAMSGRMKTLFDRFTDLITRRDPARRGRRFAGRQVWLLAVGTDPEAPAGFEVPFRSTAGYFAMDWRDWTYVSTRQSRERQEERVGELASRVAAALA